MRDSHSFGPRLTSRLASFQAAQDSEQPEAETNLCPHCSPKSKGHSPLDSNALKKLATQAGLQPATSALGKRTLRNARQWVA